MSLSKVSVGTSPTLIAPWQERKGIIISNLSAQTIYLSVSGDTAVSLPAGSTPGIPLYAGERYFAAQEDRRSVVSNQAIYGIAASGTADVSVEAIL